MIPLSVVLDVSSLFKRLPKPRGVWWLVAPGILMALTFVGLHVWKLLSAAHVPRVGSQSVVIGDFRGSVGDGSVVIYPMDEGGNIILNRSMAIGYGARAGEGSIAIGAHAGAGEAPANPKVSHP